MTRAHRAGCAYLDRMYRCPIPEKADIVLVSQGGAPKDANLYQTQKALDNAKHAVKDGGTIILIGACPEGLGSKTFSDWLLAAPTAHSMVERISRNFQLGGHKAAAIAMVLEKASIDLISEMDDDFCPPHLPRAKALCSGGAGRRLPEIRPRRHRPRHAPRRLNTAVSAGRRPRSQPDITN